MTETVKLVRMVRHADTNPPPHVADVHPDEVANYAKGGWAMSEDQAEAVTVAPVITGTGEGEALPLYIPDDWKTQHWKKRVALAKALGWVDGEPTTEQADGWISDILVHRAREVPQEALGGLSIREAHDKLTKAGVEWDAGATVEDLAAMLATVA